MKLERVSHSTLAQAARCGEQLRFRLQEGPEPPGFALIRGRAVAKSIEANMTAKLREGAALPVELLAELTRDAVVSECAAGDVRLDADGEQTFDQARDETIDSAVELSDLHARKVAPGIAPTAVEARIELVSGSLPVPLVGVLDLIALEPSGGESIRDAKTTGKKPPDDSADVSDQLTVYDALYRAERGRKPERLVLDHLVESTKTMGPRAFEHDTTPREPADFDALSQRIERVVRMVELELWIPAPETAWWCSAKSCGYWPRCAFARGRARPTS